MQDTQKYFDVIRLRQGTSLVVHVRDLISYIYESKMTRIDLDLYIQDMIICFSEVLKIYDERQSNLFFRKYVIGMMGIIKDNSNLGLNTNVIKEHKKLCLEIIKEDMKRFGRSRYVYMMDVMSSGLATRRDIPGPGKYKNKTRERGDNRVWAYPGAVAYAIEKSGLDIGGFVLEWGKFLDHASEYLVQELGKIEPYSLIDVKKIKGGLRKYLSSKLVYVNGDDQGSIQRLRRFASEGLMSLK